MSKFPELPKLPSVADPLRKVRESVQAALEEGENIQEQVDGLQEVAKSGGERVKKMMSHKLPRLP